ncbi:Tex family protein [Candidatus Halocynthiibacter alkanivorans]|uniref:Tex family protein n=1 Tax=Candidatus Halocynthiibacter alkanivorans TaxID=2267619 RepID=UPI000DF44830|nr:Tex family protein [Candidatus Halocynthiibacter alkanivorans]
MTPETSRRIASTIATEISARPDQVVAAVSLLDEGSTVPFVARYRKEATGGLDDTQLRNLAERLVYLRELEQRRGVILQTIRDQGKMTDMLEKSINGASTKAVLEDIYLPYKTKRRTKATIARENGLEPLADAIRANRAADPQRLATAYNTDAVVDVKAALMGARDIIVEGLVEDATLIGRLRDYMQKNAWMNATVIKGEEDKGAKFSDYFAHSERWSVVPGHRALAMLRASKEQVLTLEITPGAENDTAPVEAMICGALQVSGQQPGDLWLRTQASWAWRIKLSLSMTLDLMADLRRRSHDEAIRVFARNLKDLLLAAPAGPRATLGLDPGIRTGCKIAVVDATGKVLDTATVYPFQPRKDIQGSMATIAGLIRKHGVDLIAIGNGTASRESERLIADVLQALPTPKPTKVIVSEAGASVYSASELAAKEFPDLDVSLRGAVSIARRLQDPLAELVKIEPKSIGVGQYQHDVDQFRLGRSLEAVVEDAVNAVGVDLNMASAPLLAHVSGLSPALAESIVAYRDENGAFESRKALMEVPRLGSRTFEQCAGFLRIADSKEPLDGSAVHPEAYRLARRIIKACGRDLRALRTEPALLANIAAEDFVDEKFGLPTVRDILAELEKPGRDPRPEFVTASFTDGVEDIKDLKPGMSLEGTVTNVAAFGAFIDVGVHQDGLVHVSQLADRFVKDPHEVVKAGDVVKVRVVEVDIPRKRIGLTMRKDNAGQQDAGRGGAAGTRDQDRRGGSKPGGGAGGKFQGQSKQGQHKHGKNQHTPNQGQKPAPKAAETGAFGAALLDAMKKK